MENYCIYIHKNKINNKVYVGQTKQKPEYRWGQNGKKYEQCPKFYNAIQKYGWDNFEHIILESNLTEKEANIKEQYWIQYYNSIDNGYNLSLGGNNRTPSIETSQKISNRLKQEWQDGTRSHEKMSTLMKEKWKDPDYLAKQKIAQEKNNGKSFLSEEGRQRISDARKKYIQEYGTPTQGIGHTEEAKQKIRMAKIGEKNPMYGTHHTDEWKEKMSIRMSGKNSPQAKKVRCITTGEIFDTCTEAQKFYHTSAHIGDACKGRRKSCGTHPITKEKLTWEFV